MMTVINIQKFSRLGNETRKLLDNELVVSTLLATMTIYGEANSPFWMINHVAFVTPTRVTESLISVIGEEYI